MKSKLKDIPWWEKEKSLRFFSLELTGTVYSENLKELNIDEIMSAVKEMHCNVFLTFGCGHGTKTYFKSKFLPHHEKLGKRDLIKELIAACHKKGVYFVTYNNHHDATLETIKKHPEWLLIDKNGNPPDIHNCFGHAICFNSPSFELYLEALREQVEMGVDGIFLDGVGRCDGCYCEGCRKQYKKDTGKDLLKASVREDSRWREKRYAIRIGEAYNAIKNANKECMFFINGIRKGTKLLRKYADAVGEESFFGVKERQSPPLFDPAYVAKAVKGCTKKNQCAVVYSRYAQSPWAHAPNTDAELKYAAVETVAHGGIPWYSGYDTGFFDYRAGWKAIGEVYRFIDKAGEYIKGSYQKAEAVMLISSVHNESYARFNSHARGFFEALTHARIPVDFLAASLIDKDKLQKYKLLIIPGLPVLSDKQAKEIKTFLKAGGKAIATYNSSCLDDNGSKRSEYPLPFGVDMSDAEEYNVPNNSGYLIPDHQSQVLGQLHGKSILPVVGSAVRVIPQNGSEVIAWLEERDLKTSYSNIEGISKNPGIVLNSEKNILFSLADIDRVYFINRQAIAGEILKKLVTWFLGQSACLNTNAPQSVDVVLRYQDKPERRIIHLVNTTSTPVRPMDEIVPVHDIHITIPDFMPGRVFSVGGNKIDWVKNGNGVNLIIDKLSEYDIIVLEK